MPVWQTTTPFAAVSASPSGPARPPENWMKSPALFTRPEAASGSRQTALARVTARNSTCSSRSSTSPFGLGTLSIRQSSRPVAGCQRQTRPEGS